MTDDFRIPAPIALRQETRDGKLVWVCEHDMNYEECPKCKGRYKGGAGLLEVKVDK